LKLESFEFILDSDEGDSEQVINHLRSTEDKARKWANKSRENYRSFLAVEFDEMAMDLDAKIKGLLEPDQVQLDARDAIKKWKLMLEDDDEEPDNLLDAAKEAAAFVEQMKGVRKYGKELRDCQQYIDLLETRAKVQEIAIVRIIEKKYKPIASKFILMRKWLLKNGVDAKECKACKRVFEVWELGKKNGLNLPHTLEGLKS